MKKGIIIAVIVVLIFVGISYLSMQNTKEPVNTNETPSNQSQNTLSKDKEKATIKELAEEEYEIKVVGFESRNQNGEYNSENDNLFWKYNANPQIDMKEESGKLIVECYTGNKDGVKYWKNEDSLSFLVKGTELETDFYHTFNIDLKNKKILSQEEFLTLIGREKSTVEDKVKKIEYRLTSENCEKAKKKAENMEDMDDFLAWLDDMLYNFDEKFDFAKIQFYKNENGDLCYASKVYNGVIAGANEKAYLYNIDLNEVIN